MAEAHQVHQRDARDDKIVTMLISFLPEGNKKISIHKEKSVFRFLPQPTEIPNLYLFCIVQNAKWMESDNY